MDLSPIVARFQAYAKKQPRLADLIALVGGVVYVLNLAWFGITQRSVLDEGLYLYKGLIFATGQYFPFQDYGPWTNQMPFSYLIPGFVQIFFGPGLRTARILALLIAVLMLAGLWLTSRRMGNAWLAAVVVWIFAINPAGARYYSMAASQSLVACLLMWTIFFTLGKDRKLWQVLAGVFLACVTIFVRINMIPVLPMLILYILWEHGWKKATWALLTGAFFFALFHAMYWPGVLRMWAYWLPENVIPFLEAWQLPAGAESIWQPIVTTDQNIESFFQIFRSFFPLMAGFLTAWLLWPRKAISQHKPAIFVSILFITLLGLHAWASLGNNYCTYCFTGYGSFFIGLPALLIVISIRTWQYDRLSTFSTFLAMAVILILFSGIFMGVTEINPGGVIQATIDNLLKFELPRFKEMRFQPGTVAIQQLLANIFNADYYTIPQVFRTYAPLLVGLLSGIMFLGVMWIIHRTVKPGWRNQKIGYVPFSLFSFLIMGTIISPSTFMANSYRPYDCNSNVIAAFEKSGNYLRSTIPDGALVYWGGYTPTNLLYIPNARPYPPQLNIRYDFSTGGDTDELLRYGWWNQELSDRWMAEADYVLFEQRYFVRGGKEVELLTSSGKYEELAPAPPTALCNSEEYYIRIFRRLP